MAAAGAMFQVKICGIATVDDAQMVVAAGADAVGLNFYRESRRFLPAELADAIVGELPPHVVKVGVFVNSTADEVRNLANRFRLDMVQLHGDEPPEMLADLKGLNVVRALRCRSSLSEANNYLERCEVLGQLPDAVLIDAFDPTQYGGTGRTVDWSMFAENRGPLVDLPLVLAGGLTAQNVRQAVEAVMPTAVDTASGVEGSPGRKSREKVETFIRAAREAFESVRAQRA
jgi:phosphoribosylanthranilate isomerase